MADQASTVFGSDKPATPEEKKPTESSTQDNPLGVLVGEGRKYKTAEELAKAYLEIDSFTEKLKGENAEMREKLAGSKTIDDVLTRLSQREAPASDKGAEGQPTFSADAIAKIVNDVVTGRETARTRQENLLKADAAMKKLFGEKAQAEFEKVAATPEMRKALQNLAEVAPAQFVKMFSPGSQTSGSQTDSGSTVNTVALGDSNQSGRVSDPGAKEYYDAVRAKDRRKYYSADFQLAMHKAAQANPEKFFGRKVG